MCMCVSLYALCSLYSMGMFLLSCLFFVLLLSIFCTFTYAFCCYLFFGSFFSSSVFYVCLAFLEHREHLNNGNIENIKKAHTPPVHCPWDLFFYSIAMLSCRNFFKLVFVFFVDFFFCGANFQCERKLLERARHKNRPNISIQWLNVKFWTEMCLFYPNTNSFILTQLVYMHRMNGIVKRMLQIKTISHYTQEKKQIWKFLLTEMIRSRACKPTRQCNIFLVVCFHCC